MRADLCGRRAWALLEGWSAVLDAGKHGANSAAILLLDWGHDMQGLPQFINEPDMGRLHVRMLGVLREVGNQCSPIESSSGGDVGCDSQIQARTQQGGHFELRQPEIGETPLSAEEIGHARRIGVIT